MRNSNDTIGNRTRDIPACGVVAQSTAPPRAPSLKLIYNIYSQAAPRREHCVWRTLCGEIISVYWKDEWAG
jgi:hypothetical protein